MNTSKKNNLQNKTGKGFAITIIVFPIIIAICAVISYLHLGIYNSFTHHTSDADNVFFSSGQTRQDPAEAWLSALPDGSTTEGVIYSLNFTNKGSTEIVDWNAKITFHDNCYLNSGWNGEVEIHQNVNKQEKVQRMALSDIGKIDLELENYMAGDACLIKIYEGDYIIYYPSEIAQEKPIKLENPEVGIGLIIYNDPGKYVDLNDVETTYYKHKNFEESPAYFAVIIITIIWVILLAYFAGSNYRKSRRLSQEVIELNIKAKDEAVAANKEKTQFLSNMSHDIRTPMNAVIGFTRMAIKHIDEKEKVQDCLMKIDAASEHLLALVNEVLDISHIESGRVELNPIAVDLNSFLDNILHIFQAQAESKQIRLNTDVINLEHEYVMLDQERFQRVIMNLVGNAIKYTDSKGRVVIRLEEKPCKNQGYANYSISIEDNGHGMSKEFLPHVFDSFTREENKDNIEIEGNGLGLAITKRTIELMDGNITVDSVLGAGSKFNIDISLIIAEKPASDKNARIITLDDYKDIPRKYNHVLIVDDNEINRELAMEILKGLNFNISFAINGLEALNMIKNNPAGTIDLILMDIRMPVMDGYEATRQIRNLPEPSKNMIPIYAVTADAFESDRQKSLEAGMNGYIRKPIEIEELLKVLVEL